MRWCAQVFGPALQPTGEVVGWPHGANVTWRVGMEGFGCSGGRYSSSLHVFFHWFSSVLMKKLSHLHIPRIISLKLVKNHNYIAHGCFNDSFNL